MNDENNAGATGNVAPARLTYEAYRQDPSAAAKIAESGRDVIVETADGRTMLLAGSVDMPGSWEER